MRRLGPALLLVLLTAGGTLLLDSRPPSPSSCKPTAPIDLTAELVGDPAAPFGVVARATSRTGAEVELEIVLPEGVTPLAGERKLKGRRCEARLDLKAADRSRREILVRATFTEGGATMTRVVPLVLFDAPAPPRGAMRKNARGETILELAP
jgi:hypothetical protein